MKFETKAVHSGATVDETTGAIAPPIHLSTTFERTADGKPLQGYGYIRDENPTQDRLEEALAAIDSAEAALAFSSGMAAATALLQSLPRDAHVLLPADGYYAVRTLAKDFFPRWSLTSDFVAMSDVDAVRNAVRDDTKMIWCETPSNPLMTIADIGALAEIAHARGAMLVVDGTFATPALQRPIEHGADIVMHSATKYLGGHSDVHGGTAAFAKRNEYFENVLHTRTNTGGVASPFNNWLILRGIRSLSARMRVHCENARAVAAMLESHPRVETVHYPGLASHPGHEVAKKQMSDFGGMISFRVREGRDAAIRIVGKVKVFTSATSLGGVESIIEHRRSTEGEESTAPENLVRMSVGLEDRDDLVEDLAQALR